MRGDMMFVCGAFAEESYVPVGASFAQRGMRDTKHDAVAAELLIPIRDTRPSAATDWPVLCLSPSTSEDSEAGQIYEELRTREEDDNIPEDMQHDIRRLIHGKKTVNTGGVKRKYVKSQTEAVSTIKRLLRRRRADRAANGLLEEPPASDGAPQPAGVSGGGREHSDDN